MKNYVYNRGLAATSLELGDAQVFRWVAFLTAGILFWASIRKATR